MTHQLRVPTLLLVLSLAVACPQSLRAGNLLLNGGFDTPTPGLAPPNYPTSITGANSYGDASAADWTLFNSRDATTSTELLPSSDPNGSGNMIHLTSVTNTADPNGSFFNGLQQGFSTVSGATASVDVDVLSGPAILALYAGNGSTLVNYEYIFTTNQWETVSITAPLGTNPNLFVLYSGSTSGIGEFYADNAVVTPLAQAPEPSTLILALLGLPMACLYSRKF